MSLYSIHISGIVQGVGFRPFIYQLAKAMHLNGQVSNHADGVHVIVDTDEQLLKELLQRIRENSPKSAKITAITTKAIQDSDYSDFHIVASQEANKNNGGIAPDMGLCDSCKAEIFDSGNKRYHYAFTHCTTCGPRYSVIKSLPFDRERTTLQPFKMCTSCQQEYANPFDRRFHAQICSCPDCAIPMQLTDNQQQLITDIPETLFKKASELLASGKILAVKGIGGYLLLCDAGNKNSIRKLRRAKSRGNKPFAVMYKDLNTVRQDCLVSRNDAALLTSAVAPIVILPLSAGKTNIAIKEINPLGNTVGAMLPYTPILAILAASCRLPLVATSGNKAGESIAYTTEMAIHQLTDIADYFIHFDREIIAPEDDSVVRSSLDEETVILRRSRGYAPSITPPAIDLQKSTIAFGADLKSAFVLTQEAQLVISPYLGNLSCYSAQIAYRHTLEHLQQLTGWKQEQVLADLHPGYHSTLMAQQFAEDTNIPITLVPHHEAHAMAVIAENQLINTNDRIVVAAWDGTGYSPDGHIAGSEIYLYTEGLLQHIASLKRYPHLAGERMATDTRLPMLSISGNIKTSDMLQHFSSIEKQVYGKLIEDPATLSSTSMGRLFDAVACQLGICSNNTFEGEAAILLEQLALESRDNKRPKVLVQFASSELTLSGNNILNAIHQRLAEGIDKATVAYDFHYTLVLWLLHVASEQKANGLALSGGVFQNLLLLKLIKESASDNFTLYTHKVLSPNDECIAYGQIAWKAMQEKRTMAANREQLTTVI